MELAWSVAQWSKDPSTQCGAVFVGEAGQVLAQGYNGFPRGIDDDKEYYLNRETKYERICHAEMNAIYNACRTGVSLKNSIAYVHGLPCCHECAKAMIQVGVKEVVMRESSDPRWNDSCTTARNLLDEAQVKITYI
jgi:dCMP deaminase